MIEITYESLFSFKSCKIYYHFALDGNINDYEFLDLNF
jgi:hypothetical protein